jgi:hypothetical protein
MPENVRYLSRKVIEFMLAQGTITAWKDDYMVVRGPASGTVIKEEDNGDQDSERSEEDQQG